jgi:hypothetical protein
MPAYSVTCPECRTNLKSGRPIAPGTPLECPKCQVMFAAPKPRPAARPAPMVQPRHRDEVVDDVEIIDDVDVVDDVEVIDEVEVVDEAPARRRNGAPARRRPASADFEVVDDEDDDEDDRPRKKFKSKKKKGSNPGLMIGLVVVGAVVLLGGAGYGVYYLFGGGGDGDPLAYLNDQDILMSLNIGKVSEQMPAIRGAIDQAIVSQQGKAAVDAFKSDTGIEAKDFFDKVYFSFDPQGMGQKGVMVIQSRQAFSRSGMNTSLKRDGTPQTLQGASYYQLKSAGGFNRVFSPTRRLVVFASLPEAQFGDVLKVDAGKPKLSAEKLALVRKLDSNHAWLVVGKEALTGQAGAAGMSMMPGQKELAELAKQAKLLAIWGTLNGSTAEISVGFQMPDAAAAKQATDKMQTFVPQQLNMAGVGMAIMPGMPAGMKQVFDEIKQSLTFTTQESMAVMAFRVNTAAFQSMAGQMGGPAAVPPPPRTNTPPPAAPTGRPTRRGANPGGGGGGGRP